VLLAGVIAAIVAFSPNRSAPKEANNPVSQALAPKPTAKPKTVPLPKGATAVARQFILTAVARKDLRAAWKIVSPNVRGGLTYKQWLTGDIPVVPYPIGSLQIARFKIDWSYARQVGLEVILIPKNSNKIKPQDFFILLKKVGTGTKQRWIVDSWVPHSAPLVPLGPAG
jgi:hypothetical protein